MKKYIRGLRWRWNRLRYGSGHPPRVGSGKWVSVRRRRGSVEIEKHLSDSARIPVGTIRLIPYQPNHGVFVEFQRPDGTIGWRNVMPYSDFWNRAQLQQEAPAHGVSGRGE